MPFPSFSCFTAALIPRRYFSHFMPWLRLSASILYLPSLLYIGLSNHTAYAQCTSHSSPQITWNKESYDPKPSTDADTEELVLPMPCGSAMVFRRVEVAAPTIGNAKFLANRKIRIGRSMTPAELHAQHSNAYNIYQYNRNLAAAFHDKSSNPVYYIGKYEVSAAQYKAVMEETGNAPLKRKNFPVNNLSFLEAQQFAEKWTTWLRKNAPERLPKRGNDLGFIRLPTDAEWSFAANGGIKNETANPWPQTDSDCSIRLDDCIVGSSQGRSIPNIGVLPQPIGSLNIANPLSLYDIVGNVSEMVLTPYQMNLYGDNQQRQGLPGGIQIFGGSVLNKASDLSSAFRTELAPYTKDGNVQRSPDVGFRVVIGANTMGDLKQSQEAQNSFRELVKFADNLHPSQVRQENDRADLALDKLKQTISQNNQDKTELQNRITELTQRIDAARNAQIQADMQRDQASQENVTASLTTLLTLSKQIAIYRVTIANYTSFVNDPDNYQSANLGIYKKAITDTQTSLNDTTNNYMSILKTISTDPRLESHLQSSKDLITSSLNNNYKDTQLLRRIRWLNISINNIKNVSLGATPDLEKDVKEPIEKSAQMSYYKK